ncbi:EAL domain-containing response regulator [Iodobacter sp. LRB]|uniref:EAL domain-containing response regulator n=1 Tax=unclassified Iodobacter TaxID=235634 RepID=UPI000C0FE867|nr:EAL domain-containing response regulator [Iodobacter sp. BJB302]PHV03549.1 diguanylate phosphodiesterase [Iodobacter sp. BJB302]
MSHLEKWRGRIALVVDDSPSHRFVAVEYLKEIGFAGVHEAADGNEALHILQTLEQVDLILTDLSMPGMDGIELLGCLAKTPKQYFISVMSSVPRDVLDTVQGIADASSLELLAVIPKPLTLEAICALLQNSDPDLHIVGSPWPQLEFSVEDVACAMEANELRLYFQPKVTIVNKKLVGFEALARWLHPAHGVLPPIAFIHHIEQGELALRFFYALLSSACDMLKAMQTISAEIHCSVNLPVPLLDSAGLVDKMQAIVESKGIDSKYIVVEVTETTLMSNLATFLGALARMRLKGFGVAMDDYGTGYSSMKQLSRCPFTEIKIDKEFVHDAFNSTKKLAILTSAISMSQRLNLKTVAEGVETADDWDQLSALGCDIAQGYFISRPIPEENVLEWIANWQAES